MHWKLVIGFILLPLAALAFFGVILNMINDSGTPIPDAVYIFATLFGTLGFTLIFTILFRAKRIEVNKNELILSRIFTPYSFNISLKDVESYGIENRCDGGGYMIISNCYELIQIKTSEGKFYYFLSYEITQFEELKKWLNVKKIRKTNISLVQMYKSEYKLSFICGLVTTILLVCSVT
jgi:hypothetical protein